MLEFMRRQSLDKGVIHYSVICILVSEAIRDVEQTIMASLIRSVGGLSKYFCQGL